MAEAKHRRQVSVPIKSLFECILDFDAYPRFASGVKEARIVEKSADGVVVRMKTEIMKPIDYTIDVKSEITGDQAKIWWTLKDGDFFQKNDGKWNLVKIDENTTDVTYSLDLEFAVSVPSFILKGLIKTSLPKAINDFSEEALKRSR